MDQTSIFDLMYEKYKITKPIRLIEFFSGYGSQALALKYLGVKFEHWKTCEWAIKSIQAYKDIHFTDADVDYSKDLTKEELQEYLFNKGISSNYNEPMKLDQIKRLNEKQLRTIYNNIQTTHNLVNIQQVKGKDLNIVDADKYDYILTYSFPCQDLSLAGKGKGMSDTSTRSGMLWEVERILTECYELGNMPQILLMENVPQVHSVDNVGDFNKWQIRLEELGYKNYFQDLIATDYGIPQTRNRCFMISILGDYSYTFPKPIPLKLKLKDMLEDNVDQKYFLSDKMIEFFTHNEEKQKENGNGFRFNVSDGDTIAKTITTRSGSRMDDNFIKEGTAIDEKYYLSDKMKDYIISKDDKYKVNDNKLVINRDIACSKTTREGNTRADTSDYICRELPENTNILKIKNATKQGYLEATDGDGIDISGRMQYHRGTVQKGMTQTISTMGGENNGVVVVGNYTPSNHNASRVVDQNYSAPTVTENHDTVTAVALGTYQYAKSDKFMKGKDRLQLGKEVSDTLQTTQKEGIVNSDLKIRKLTPKECFRLMGVKDEDYLNCAKNQSDASLYHLAGDSIVVNVLMAIFKELM